MNDDLDKVIAEQIRRLGLAIKMDASAAEQAARARMIAGAIVGAHGAMNRHRWRHIANRFTATFGCPYHKIPVWEWARHLAAIDPLSYADPMPPPCRCDAEPGTEAKIVAMRQRGSQKYGFYHPDDCEPNPDDRGVRAVTRYRNGADMPGDLGITAVPKFIIRQEGSR